MNPIAKCETCSHPVFKFKTTWIEAVEGPEMGGLKTKVPGLCRYSTSAPGKGQGCRTLGGSP